MVHAHLIAQSQALLCLNVALKGLVIDINLFPKLWALKNGFKS